MTRDEHRAKCIEAMARATALHVEGVEEMWPDFIAVETAAFDSLHGFATVNAPNATEEMISEGRLAFLKTRPGEELYQRLWLAMSSTGALTNPPETKP